MHIPDGFLNLPVLISTGTFSAGMLAISSKKINKNISPERIPLMGLSAAFVFTAQLLSFPVLGGTSVHISGSLLIAILLGPFSGFLITSSAIILQALLFQHGGLLTIGANILNIAFIQAFLGYYLFRIFPEKKYLFSIFFSVTIIKILASATCASELIISGTIPFREGMISMVSAHLIAGIIESIVTIFIFSILRKLSPEIFKMEKI